MVTSARTKTKRATTRTLTTTSTRTGKLRRKRTKTRRNTTTTGPTTQKKISQKTDKDNWRGENKKTNKDDLNNNNRNYNKHNRPRNQQMKKRIIKPTKQEDHKQTSKQCALAVHCWIHSVFFFESPPWTSPIGFLFWNFRHRLVRYYWYEVLQRNYALLALLLSHNICPKELFNILFLDCRFFLFSIF